MFTNLTSLLPSLSDILSGAVSGIAQYVLLSLSLYLISRALSLPCPAFAWIPYLQYYRLGQIADLYTDNRMTTAEERATAYYKPSRLRIKLIAYSIVVLITAIITFVAAFLAVQASLASFFFLFAEDEVKIPEIPELPIITTGLITCVGTILCLVFAIIFLVAYCRALCRVFTAWIPPFLPCSPPSPSCSPWSA